MSSAPKNVELNEGEPFLAVARIETAGGTPLVIGDVVSVNVSVFDMTIDDPTVAVFQEGAVDPSTVYFDALQYDDAANLLSDDGGYNFKYILHGDDYVLLGSKTYRIEIVSALGNASHVQKYDVKVGEVWS